MRAALKVFMQGAPIGELAYDSDLQLWEFNYEATWLSRPRPLALSPALPLRRDDTTPQQHSNAVRTFFENLLPEGQALEDASIAFQISKASSFGLLRVLGRETAGALEILSTEDTAPFSSAARARRVSREDISARIRERPFPPFTVWDGRVRLSIAGFQDKLAVLEENNDWYLVDGRSLASTHLLKPEPLHAPLAGMTTNERLCLAFAASLGIPTAANRLEHLPESVLVVQRFDRVRMADRIDRLHCIDGCQALGLPVSMKYEWPFGHGRDVRGIRDGASLPRLFAMLDAHAATPARERIALLRWAIIQVLIGNVDGHAKNLSFFIDAQGLRLAPAYDLVCGMMYEQKNVDDTLAMAIGDGYEIGKLGAFDWAQFSVNCKLPARLVAREMKTLAQASQKQLSATQTLVREEGGDARTIEGVGEIIKAQTAMVLAGAQAVTRSAREEFASR